MTERRCRKCGCTQHDACVDSRGPCWWVEDNLCSHCIPTGSTTTIPCEFAVLIDAPHSPETEAMAETLRRQGHTVVAYDANHQPQLLKPIETSEAIDPQQ